MYRVITFIYCASLVLPVLATSLAFYCKHSWLAFFVVGLFLCSHQAYAQVHESKQASSFTKWFQTSTVLINTTLASKFAKKSFELRIKCDDKIRSYSLSQSLLSCQPTLASYMLPTDYYTNREECDVDLSYIPCARINEVLTLISKVAATKQFSERKIVYSTLHNKIMNHEITFMQVLEYQAVLNRLCLQLDIDKNDNDQDLIVSLISDKSYYQKTSLSACDQQSLAILASHDQALSKFASLLLNR